MDFADVLHGRRSIRKFQDTPVEREVIERIIEAAFAAPIGTRDECRYFVVLTGEAKDWLVDEALDPGLERLATSLQDSAARDTVRYTLTLLPLLRQAPVVIAAYMELLNRDESLALPTVAAAVQNLLLAAYNEGLGACWTTGAIYLGEDIREHLGLEDKELVALVPLGYPAEEAHRRSWPQQVDWRGSGDAPPPAEPKAATSRHALPDWVPAATESSGAEILVSDRSPSTRRTIRQALTEAGYVVREADPPDRVITLVRERPPSLVILDALFAGQYGANAARRLQEEAGSYVPVLLTAAAYHLEDKARALSLGADGFIGKPIRWPELLGQVRSLLRTKGLYDDLQRTKGDLQELMHHRDHLTDMIVHDLRSPLSGILGTVQYVLQDEDSKLDPSARDLLDMSVEGGQTLLGMVNDLLDVSKMSEVGLPLNLEPVDVRAAAEAAVRQLARPAAEKAVELRSAVPDGLPPVPADREKLQRVLVNLVGNAVKFTAAQGQVCVSAHTDDNAGTMDIAVSDTGMGIPEADRDRIFDLFAQVESGGPERRQGTGLGLTFCRVIVQGHHGTITVDSEEGKGSTFTVHLPLAAQGT